MENDKDGRNINSVSIPHDLVVEILTRLPSKSVLKFKCLAKQYLSIIESRNFVYSHWSCSSKKPSQLFSFLTTKDLVLYSATTTRTSTSPTFPSHVMSFTGNSLHIRAPSVRGFICFSIRPNQHVICNPSTRQLLHLPQNQTWTGKEFDEYVLFGYEPISNRFKVISILSHCRNTEHQLWIFTVGDGTSWKKIQEIPYDCRPFFVLEGPLGLCLNGVLYYVGITKQKMVSFDLSSENFQLINLPPGHWKSPMLIDFQGKLALVECTKEIRVWVLEDADEKQEWSYTLYDLPLTLKYARWVYEHSRVVGICEGEIVFVSTRDQTRGLTTWHFNLDTKTSREVATLMPSNNNLYLHVCSIHIDNLLSL